MIQYYCLHITGVTINLFIVQDIVSLFETYDIFDENGNYTTDALVNTLANYNKDKVVLILNYPNNPTGYTPTKDQVNQIVTNLSKT